MPENRLPRLDAVGRPSAAATSAVLLLPGGRSRSHESGERTRLTHLRMLPFGRPLVAAGPAVHLLRYRYRGWNAPAADPVLDTTWALEEIASRHPGAPVVLVGHSMGGRAALWAAGAANVTAVCALAPWLDGSDPVDQLAGRTVLIAHGDRERIADPGQSYSYALRAKRVTERTARFELPGAGHYMLTRAADWHRLVRRFVLGTLGLAPEDPAITNAMGQPAPDGLRAAVPTS